MKYSIAVVAASAILASASPLMVTEWVTDVVTVTATADVAIPTKTVVASPKVAKPAPESPSPAPPKPKPAPPKKPIVAAQEKPAPKASVAPAPVAQPGPEMKKKPSHSPSKPSPSKPAPPSAGGDYQSTCLKHHNYHRANHSAPALEWDDDLASWAEQVAKKCIFAHDKSPGDGQYGQNLAAQGTTGSTEDIVTAIAASITDEWYNKEIGFVNFFGSNPSMANFPNWGHVTQLIWKSTEKVGCYTQLCPGMLGMDTMFTVCDYGPSGNYPGQYPENVLESLGEASISV